MKYYSEDYRVTKESKEESEETISGAGGGCFPAGTLVRTAHGFKPIEVCAPGEIILAYDRFGIIDYAAVTAINIHTTLEYVDDIYYLYSEGKSIFPKGITGNHAVFDHITGEHKEVKDFSVGENLVDLNNNLIEITEIVIIPHEEANCTVYNLTVEPQHTFLVGQEFTIRVHNGGGGKSSAGAARAAQEAPNTLQSNAIAKVLEVVSHGKIAGIVGGAKGVYFNGTPIQNADNSYNFQNVFFDQRVGDASQTAMAGFENTENEVTPPNQIIAPGSSHTVDLPDANVPEARVTISLPDGLWEQNTSNGDLNGFTCSYSIQVSDVLGSFYTVLTKTISGKTTSAYEIAHLVQAPAGATHWRIRVVNNNSPVGASAKNTLQFARVTELFHVTETYNNIAYAGIKIAAKETGNSIPARGYDVMGILVDVPHNYNPVTRTYTGYWNKSFAPAKQWTDNPAWILLDLITNPFYGIQTFLGQNVAVDLDAFYEASLYNDCVTWNGSTNLYNLVPDGYGGTEVRYKFNAVIATQQDAWQLLHAVASNMRALLCMKGNLISLIQDRPKEAVKILNNSNVIDGIFLYSSSEVTSRATAINCTFNDINDRYLPKTISEPSEDILTTAWYGNAHTKYGYTVKDIVAYGCVTESQARRMAKWALYTEINQPEMVTFSLALNVLTLMVGDVISVMDNDKASDTTEYYAGRIVSVVGTEVTLDRPISILAGHVYTLGVTSLDYASIEERTLTDGAGVHSVVHINTSLPAGDYTEKEFMLFSVGLVEPTEFQIVSISESDRGIYAITAIQYDKNKFALIEDGLTITPPVYSRLVSSILPQVSNITFSEVFMNDGINVTGYIRVSWDWTPATYFNGTSNVPYSDPVTYSIRWRRDNNAYQIVHNIPIKDFQIPDTTPGVYEVIIEVTNLQGKKSVGTYATYSYRVTVSASTLDAPTNFVISGTSGLSFTGTFASLEWTYPSSNDLKTDRLYDYLLEVWSADGLTKLNSYVINPIDTKFLEDGTTPNPLYKGGTFVYNLPLNAADFGTPSRTILTKLYSRDTTGRVSTANIKIFTNAVPAAVNFTVMSGVSSVYVRIDSSPEADVKGYRVWRISETDYVTAGNVFVKNESTLVYDGVDTYITLNVPSNEQYRYAVAAYDDFGKTGLNISSEQTSTPLSVDAAQWSQSGITFSIGATNRLDWTSGTIYKNGSPVSITAGNVTYTGSKVYVYYSGTGNTLSTTTNIATAVGAGTYPLATYTGGGIQNVKGGDGSAFTSGSEILAGTVGAAALVSGTAVITETAQIQAAIIEKANLTAAAIAELTVADHIESANYSPTRKEGFRIDTTGLFETYGKIKIGTQNVGVGTATSTFVPGALTLNGNASLNNSIIKKLGATAAWDEQGYSSQSYTGNCVVSFSFAQVNGKCIAGLNTDPTSAADNTSIDFGIFADSDGKIYKIESGTQSAELTTYTVDDYLSIEYSGTTVTYKKNGTSISTTTTTSGQTFFFDSSIYTQNAIIDQIKFGQYQMLTPDYGARMEITGEVIKVYDRNNVLRVQIGNLSI